MTAMPELSAKVPRPPYATVIDTEFQEFAVDAGRVRMAYAAKPEFCNPAGVVQGGFLGGMLDDAMGLAVILHSRAEQYPSTIDMNVSFLRPARPGQIIAEATVIQVGATIDFVEGALRDAAGQILARATCSVRLTHLSALRPAGPAAQTAPEPR